MEIKFESEEIGHYPTSSATRVRVPGGWLVSIVLNAGRGAAQMTTNFVADPDWEWTIPIPVEAAEER